MNAFRLPGLLVVIGLLVGGLVIDQSREAPEVAERAIGLPGTAVAPDDAISSTWLCAAATAGTNDTADSEVVLANTRPTPARASISVFRGSSEPSGGSEVSELDIDLPAQAATSVRLADLAPDSEIVSIAVEIDSGGSARRQDLVGSSWCCPYRMRYRCIDRVGRDVWGDRAGSPPATGCVQPIPR